MKYAVTNSNVIWSIHNKPKKAIAQLSVFKKQIPSYPYCVKELFPKGEKQNWTRGDNPHNQYWGKTIYQS